MVHFIGDGDFGCMSISGGLVLNSGEQITDRTAGITVDENLPDDRFYFSYELMLAGRRVNTNWS